MKAKLVYVNNGKPELDLELWDETHKICGFADVQDFGRLEAAIDGVQERVRELEEEVSRLQFEDGDQEDNEREILQLEEDLEWVRGTVRDLENENRKLRSAGKKVSGRIKWVLENNRNILDRLKLRVGEEDCFFMEISEWLIDISESVEELEEEE